MFDYLKIDQIININNFPLNILKLFYNEIFKKNNIQLNILNFYFKNLNQLSKGMEIDYQPKQNLINRRSVIVFKDKRNPKKIKDVLNDHENFYIYFH